MGIFGAMLISCRFFFAKPLCNFWVPQRDHFRRAWKSTVDAVFDRPTRSNEPHFDGPSVAISKYGIRRTTPHVVPLDTPSNAEYDSHGALSVTRVEYTQFTPTFTENGPSKGTSEKLDIRLRAGYMPCFGEDFFGNSKNLGVHRASLDHTKCASVWCM